MITVQLSNIKVSVRGNFRATVDFIKSLQGRTYDAQHQEWSIPMELSVFAKQCPFKFDAHILSMAEVTQPVGYARCFVLICKVGDKKDRASISAKLVTPIQRWHCGMTVGHGLYARKTSITPAGTDVEITGFWSDGAFSVKIDGTPFRVCANHVEIDWSEVPQDVQDFYSTHKNTSVSNKKECCICRDNSSEEFSNE